MLSERSKMDRLGSGLPEYLPSPPFLYQAPQRPVEVKEVREGKEGTRKAFFHCFMPDSDSGAIAVVEYEDGSLDIFVDILDIRFTDREKPECPSS